MSAHWSVDVTIDCFLLMKEIKKDVFAILNCKTVYWLFVQQVAVKSQMSHFFPIKWDMMIVFYDLVVKQTKYYRDNYITFVIKRLSKFRFPDFIVTIPYKIFNQIVQKFIRNIYFWNPIQYSNFFLGGGIKCRL